MTANPPFYLSRSQSEAERKWTARELEKGSAGGCVGGDEADTLFRGCGVHRTVDTAKVLEQYGSDS